MILSVQLLTAAVCWFFLYFPLLFIMGITGYFQVVIFNHIFVKLIAERKITETNRRHGGHSRFSRFIIREECEENMDGK